MGSVLLAGWRLGDFVDCSDLLVIAIAGLHRLRCTSHLVGLTSRQQSVIRKIDPILGWWRNEGGDDVGKKIPPRNFD